jgi:DnaJ like chaperone protein
MPLKELDPPDLAGQPGRKAGGFWAGLKEKLGLKAVAVRRLPHDSAAFTSAFVALGAKMAMADGVAVKIEAQAFEKFLEVAPGEEANVRHLYDLARQDMTGFEAYAARVNTLLEGQAELKRDVLECLLYVACADGILHPAEDRFLRVVATEFDIPDLEFLSLRALYIHDGASPYTVLGVDPASSNAALKARYRKLVSEHHPDRLIAEGAPAPVIKAATAKLAAITSAYDAITRERASRLATT